MFMSTYSSQNPEISQSYRGTPVVPATQEAEVEGSQVPGQPRQLSESMSQKFKKAGDAYLCGRALA
jgi:hypothetical protein